MKQQSVWILFALLAISSCYFNEDSDKENLGNLLNQFYDQFTEKFDAVVIGQLDWHSKMELGLGYWITAIKLRGMKQSSFQYDQDINGFVFKVPALRIELLINDKYTVPIKVSNFEFNILLFTDMNSLRCTGTQIEYDDISLDLNAAIEYLTKKLLSLDMLKSAIKEAEMPLRNLIQKGFRDNWEKIKFSAHQIKEGTVDSKPWLKQILTDVKGIEERDGDEFWLKTRTLFSLESLKRNYESESTETLKDKKDEDL